LNSEKLINFTLIKVHNSGLRVKVDKHDFIDFFVEKQKKIVKKILKKISARLLPALKFTFARRVRKYLASPHFSLPGAGWHRSGRHFLPARSSLSHPSETD
jgi:hypothetical protein